MEHNQNTKDNWVYPTSILWVVLTLLYFMILFPKDASNIFVQYLTYIIVALIIILSLLLPLVLYRKLRQNNLTKKSEKQQNKIKTIEQIIWRNRYVLQSIKANVMQDDSLENRERWKHEKTVFVRKKIFTVISESEVSFEVVSDLVEKSLKGSAIGGIRPPTYSVLN